MSKAPHRAKYDSSHRKIGIALIFNHKVFGGNERRQRSNCDTIKFAFKSFGFDVRVKEDFTVTQIEEELRTVANRDHSDKDCLVVVVLSYGFGGSLLARDSEYSVECLWEPFMGDNCPSLADKPKLFFIEACCGEEQTPEPGTAAVNQRLSIPETGDIFVFHGVFQHEFSTPGNGNGAVFIRSLSLVLEEVANSNQNCIELSHLQRRVIQKVSITYESSNTVTRPQPIAISNLTKDFYLKATR